MTTLLESSAFVHSPSGEPHARRRATILREIPQIRELMGYDPKTAVVTVAVVLGQLALAGFFQAAANAHSRFGSWWSVLILSYIIGAVMSHWLAMSLHECSHNLALRTPQQNIGLSLFANLPMVLPGAMTFRRYHIDHHAYLGVDGKDTDLPTPIEIKHIGNRTVLKLLWLFFYMPVYLWRGSTFARPFDRSELFNIALILAADLAIFQWMGPTALVYLALSTYFGHSLHPVAAHFIHEHYTFQEGQETYSYYGVLNRVAYNVGYHNEHHDFMNVPGSRLPQLYEMAEHHYYSLKSHASWTWVLFHFVFNQKMSVSSRIVRSREDFEQGKRELLQAKTSLRESSSAAA